MMSPEEYRKKVTRNNILLSCLFGATIVFVIASVYFYNKSEERTALWKAAVKDRDIKNDSLIALSNELKQIKDTLASQKKGLENTLVAAASSKDPRNFLEHVSVARDSARNYARIGYARLKEKDFTGAMDAFSKSEKSYNGYRDSYEVYFLLWKNKNKLNDPQVQQQVFDKIRKEYNSLGILSKN